MRLRNLLTPDAHIEPIQDPAEVKKTYQHWRIRIFYSALIGYAFFYFTRKSLVFAMPVLIRDLGFTLPQLGLLTTIFSITYGFSKFASGIIADRSNPRFFMALGLMATGVINIAFGLSASLLVFALLWGLNGWFQGWGWPPVARYMTHWYSHSERGRWWSGWNTSHNIGGGCTAIFVAYCAQKWGWQYAMYLPGIVAIFAGLFLINRLRDTPQSLGLPTIEKYRNDYGDQKKGSEDQERELSIKEILGKYVLKNKFIWLLAIANFFVYMIRIGITDWSVLYLVEVKGYSIMGAGASLVWFEVGGFCGNLLAGWMSDIVYRGNRGQTMVIFIVGVICSTLLLWWSPAGYLLLDGISLFLVGMWIFGPQMLIGLTAAELAHKKAAATASGFTGWFGYLGAASAGYPLAKITQSGGWEGYFIAITVCSLVTLLLLLPLWGAKRQKMQLQPA